MIKRPSDTVFYLLYRVGIGPNDENAGTHVHLVGRPFNVLKVVFFARSHVCARFDDVRDYFPRRWPSTSRGWSTTLATSFLSELRHARRHPRGLRRLLRPARAVRARVCRGPRPIVAVWTTQMERHGNGRTQCSRRSWDVQDFEEERTRALTSRCRVLPRALVGR